MAAQRTWVTPSDLVVDGVTFRADPTNRFTSASDLFCVIKRPDLVEEYLRVIDELRPERIVELGICKGGSTALMALVAEPNRLVALDVGTKRAKGLDQLVVERGLSDSVHPIYGVDQADAAELRRIVEEEFGDEPLDLVVDDASHEVEPTRQSFNVLFPRLRPGGRYIIEDWAWAHFGYGTQRSDLEPLTTFVFETVLLLPARLGLVGQIVITRDWASIDRGPAPVVPATFDIRELYSERARSLVTYLDRTSD